jgi:hypothetical protein
VGDSGESIERLKAQDGTANKGDAAISLILKRGLYPPLALLGFYHRGNEVSWIWKHFRDPCVRRDHHQHARSSLGTWVTLHLALHEHL